VCKKPGKYPEICISRSRMSQVMKLVDKGTDTGIVNFHSLFKKAEEAYR
jgi:hypothetical protein